jgi:hypothetical protein
VTRRLAALVAPAVAVLVAVPTAGAAPRVSFDVRPASPHLATTITVTVSAPRLKAGTSYKALIDRPRFPQRVCAASTLPVTMRRLAGGRFTATLHPGPQFGADSPPAKVWCPGPATLRVERYGPGGLSTTGFAKRALRFARGSREAVPPPIPAHEMSFTLLPGSTLTAWAPGRPDRSTPVAGTLLGRFRNGGPDPRALTTTDVTGTLALPSLAPDPLCPGSTPPTSVDVDGSSAMVQRPETGSALTLVLRAQPAQLFGCGPPGGLTGTTTLTASALGTSPLNRLAMTGVVGDVALPGGSQGGITANLLVNYDFTKRWLP